MARKSIKQKPTVVVKTRGGKKYFFLYDNGKKIEQRKYSGSKVTKANMQLRVDKTGSLFENRRREKFDTGKYNEISEVRISNSKDIRRPSAGSRHPKGDIVQYLVQGEVGGHTISARSSFIGSGANKGYAKQYSSTQAVAAKNQARDNFWRQVHYYMVNTITGESDPDEGKQFYDQVTNYREGWVRYEAK